MRFIVQFALAASVAWPAGMAAAEAPARQTPLANDLIGPVVAAEAKDGRLYVIYATNVDGHLYAQSQTAASGSKFSAPEPIASDVTRAVVVRAADGVLHVVYRTRQDGHLWTRHQTGPTLAGWSDPVKIADDLPNVNQFAAVFRPDGRLQVFHTGLKDPRLVTRHQVEPDGTEWTAPARVADAVTHVAATGTSDGRVLAVVRGKADGHLYAVTQTEPNGKSFAPPQKIADDVAGWIAAEVGPDGRPRVFFTGRHDGHLYSRRQSGSGAGWGPSERVWDNVNGRYEVVRTGDGRLRVFARTADGNLYAREAGDGGTWAGPSDPVHRGVRDVAVGRNADGSLQLFVRDNDTDDLLTYRSR